MDCGEAIRIDVKNEAGDHCVVHGIRSSNDAIVSLK